MPGTGKWKHDIRISPDAASDGSRGLWYASVTTTPGQGVSYDGSGTSIEEALCDLIDNLAEELLLRELTRHLRVRPGHRERRRAGGVHLA